MNIKKTLTMKFLLHSLSTALLIGSSIGASAKPGALSDVPLYSRGSAEPNIMFVLDSSGSMQTPLYPPRLYDKDAVTTYSCKLTANTYDVLDIRINSDDGSVEFKRGRWVSKVVSRRGERPRRFRDALEYSGGWESWDSSGNCFTDNDVFGAYLYAGNPNSDGGYYETEIGNDGYRHPNSFHYVRNLKGRFLNWFFLRKNTLKSTRKINF